MATTGELRVIMQELQLVEAGDAASFLGEEAADPESVPANAPVSVEEMYFLMTANAFDTDDSEAFEPAGV